MFTARRRSQFTAGISILVAMLLLAACDWTQFRYGPDHTGFNPTETTIGPANVSRVRLRWSQRLGTQGFIQNPMTIANGVVYAVVWDKVDAFDAKTGSARWSSAAIGVGRSAPAVANGDVYVTTDRGLYALDATTGAKRWSSTDSATAPTVANGVVYVSTLGTFDTLPGLDALDARTGARLWSSTAGGGTPTVANGVVYVVTALGLYALDATIGTTLWSKVLSPQSFADPPAVASGVAYVCSYDGLHALRAATGAELWSAGSCNGSPAVANGVVLVGGSHLDAYNATTGEPLWRSGLATVVNSPVVANGVVYVGADGLDAYDAVTGAQLWSTPTIYTPDPVIANGVVYVGGNELSAYSLPLTTPQLLISPGFDSDFVYGAVRSEPRIYTITNIGSKPTSAIADGLSGSGAAHFRLTSDGCAGTSLAGGASCTVTASFAPTRAGSHIAWLTAAATAGGTTRALLTGTAEPFSISPAPWFPDTFAGMTSAETLQVTNLDDAPVGPIAFTVLQGDFTVADGGCVGKTIAAGTSCTIAVTFAPTGSGRIDRVLLADAPGHHAETDLTGTALARVKLAPASKDFVVPVGTTASARFTVTNISPIPAGPIVDAIGASYGGWGPGPFDYYSTTSDSCAGHTLAANASCAVVVTFAPTAATLEFAVLTVSAPRAGTATATMTGAPGLFGGRSNPVEPASPEGEGWIHQ